MLGLFPLLLYGVRIVLGLRFGRLRFGRFLKAALNTCSKSKAFS
jgi:hypothetical protein